MFYIDTEAVKKSSFFPPLLKNDLLLFDRFQIDTISPVERSVFTYLSPFFICKTIDDCFRGVFALRVESKNGIYLCHKRESLSYIPFFPCLRTWLDIGHFLKFNFLKLS